MKTRNRRVPARRALALVAAAGVASAAVLGVMGTAAAWGRASSISSSAAVSASVGRAAPRVLPAPHDPARRTAASRGARGTAELGAAFATRATAEVVAPGSAGGAAVTALLVGWMLGFIRRTSKTRGQPRADALA